ncbi:MAG: hypothetical protein ACK4KW_03950 [Gemmobacter sp.]
MSSTDQIAQSDAQAEARFREAAALTGIAETLRAERDAFAAALAEARGRADDLQRAIGLVAALAQARAALPEDPPGWRAALAESGLFDADWYLARYPDVAAVGMDPGLHYIGSGSFELRDPGPGFSTLHYYLANPDIAPTGMPALVHWWLHGRAEGRSSG